MSEAPRFGDFIAEEFPEPPWLIPELLTNGRSLVYAIPKGGKTYCCLQIADTLVTGASFLRWPAGSTRFKVLWVQLDQPKGSFQITARRVCPHILSSANFYLACHDWPRDPAWRIPRYFLADPLAMLQAMKIIKAIQPDVIIFDNFTVMDLGADYNNADSVKKVWSKLWNVWKGPQIIICHANKSASDGSDSRHPIERLSGSLAITADADGGIFIEPSDDGSVGTWHCWSRNLPPQSHQFSRIPRGQPGEGKWVTTRSAGTATPGASAAPPLAAIRLGPSAGVARPGSTSLPAAGPAATSGRP